MSGPPGLFTLFLNYFVVLYLCYLHSLYSSAFQISVEIFQRLFFTEQLQTHMGFGLYRNTHWITGLLDSDHMSGPTLLGYNLHTRPLLEKSCGKIWNSKVFFVVFVNFLDSPVSLQSFMISLISWNNLITSTRNSRGEKKSQNNSLDVLD